jgi:hypothetical protein
MTTPEHPADAAAPASPVSSSGCLGPTSLPDPPEHRARPPGPPARRPTGRPAAGLRPRSRPAGRRPTTRTATPAATPTATPTAAGPGRAATVPGRPRRRPATAGPRPGPRPRPRPATASVPPGCVVIAKRPDETSQQYRRRLLDTCPPIPPDVLDQVGRLLARRSYQAPPTPAPRPTRPPPGRGRR